MHQVKTVQALRGLAALLVVAYHATLLWNNRFDPRAIPWANGNAGVDLFFVISGFVMLFSARRLRSRLDAGRRFIVSRLIRIVPLYWLATTAKLAAVAVFPATVLHTRPTPWNIIASFLFVPARDAAEIVRPVLSVGWTLSFEMLFYSLFAVALAFRRDPLVIVGPAMAALAVASLAVNSLSPAVTMLASPIVLEFVLGLAVGRLMLRRRAPPPHATLLLLAGLLCMVTLPAHTGWERLAFWGIPAACALYGAVSAEPRLGSRIPKLVVGIGEASYSLYLTHAFVLQAIGLVAARAGLQGRLAGPMLIAASLVLSTIAALLVYRGIEAPITRWFRKLATRGPFPNISPEALLPTGRMFIRD